MSLQISYRPDIDGLRAIAVLPVLFFHAGIPGFSGGYIGVDVFFVISGFLITGILLRELDASEFSITKFYVRRARRILPAFYVVLAVTLVLGWMLLLPLELIQLAKNSIATIFFVSNIALWKESGYFDMVAELKPLLHTWSLSVEEQFYLFWPLALALFYRNRAVVHKWIAAVACASFLIGCVWAVKKPAAGFYLLPGRIWELLLGAGVATRLHWFSLGLRVRNILSVSGLLLLTGSIFLLDRTSAFPGWNALAPCLGAALLIGAGKDAWANKYILARQAPVFVGLISYSLYLWHWPLLVFVRVSNLGQLPLGQAIVALVVAFGLAVLTWRYVEQRFRQSGVIVAPILILRRYVIGAVAIGSTCILLVHSDGAPARVPINVLVAQMGAKDVNPARSRCHLGMDQVSLPDNPDCITGGVGQPSVLIWGDSHAEALVPGLPNLPEIAGDTIQQMTKTSCPPLLGVEVLRGGAVYRECSEFNRRVLSYVRDHPEIRSVVLSARWPVYVSETGFGVPEKISAVPKHSLIKMGEQSSYPEKRFHESLSDTIGTLRSLNREVIVIGAVPEMEYDVPSCIARQRMSFFPAGCNLDSKVAAQRMLPANKEISEVARLWNAHLVIPSKILCYGGVCSAEGDSGEILYYDHNHLSATGARYLFKKVAESKVAP